VSSSECLPICGAKMKTLLLLCLTVLSEFWQTQSVEFKCEFGYRLDHGYPCQITKGKLENENEAATFVGNHQAGKDDNDLKLISFSGNRLLRLHYFPRDAFRKFPQLNDFSLQHCQLRNLKKWRLPRCRKFEEFKPGFERIDTAERFNF